jgi:hypothetical protein
LWSDVFTNGSRSVDYRLLSIDRMARVCVELDAIPVIRPFARCLHCSSPKLSQSSPTYAPSRNIHVVTPEICIVVSQTLPRSLRRESCVVENLWKCDLPRFSRNPYRSQCLRIVSTVPNPSLVPLYCDPSLFVCGMWVMCSQQWRLVGAIM